MFSDTENKVLKMLGRKKLTIKELADMNFDVRVFDSSAVIASAIRRINKKCEYHKLDWHIAGEGLGRGGRTVWKANLK
jgi:hypothetical protein